MTRKQSKQKAKEKAQALAEERVALGSNEPSTSSTDSQGASRSVGVEHEYKVIRTWLNVVLDEANVETLIALSLDSALGLRTPNSKTSTHSLVICLKANIDSDIPQETFTVVHAGVHPLNELKSVFDARTGNDPGQAYEAPLPLLPGHSVASIMLVSPRRMVSVRHLKFDLSTSKHSMPDPTPFSEAAFKRSWIRMLMTYNWARSHRLTFDRLISGKDIIRDGCFGCYKTFPNAKLKLCSRCRMARYCSEACLRKDYNEGHREYCRMKAEHFNSLETLALRDRGGVADRNAFAEFVKLLVPDAIEACNQIKPSENSQAITEETLAASIMLVITRSSNGSDPSQAYTIERARVVQVHEVAGILREILIERFVTHADKVVQDIDKVVQHIVKHMDAARLNATPPEIIKSAGLWKTLALFVNLTSLAVRSECFYPFKLNVATDPKLLLHLYGARTSTDDWEERLKQRARISAVEPQPEADPPMSKREWARWTEEVRHDPPARDALPLTDRALSSQL